MAQVTAVWPPADRQEFTHAQHAQNISWGITPPHPRRSESGGGGARNCGGRRRDFSLPAIAAVDGVSATPPPCLKSPKYNALCLSGTVWKQNNNTPVFYLTVSSQTHNLSDVVGAVVCGAGGPHNHPPAACLPAPQVHLQQSWRPGLRHTRQARPRYY